MPSLKETKNYIELKIIGLIKIVIEIDGMKLKLLNF